MARTVIHKIKSAPQRWFGLAYLLIFIAGIGFFLLSYITLGVMPGMRLADTIASHPRTEPDYTAAELRGRRLYASLGCALCHSQQVRFLPTDVRRWGAPTEPWETRYDFPQLWGTRRIGPDLARETGVRSDDWQFTHLYNPQSIVPDSVMPSFAWLFNGRPDRPTPAASDLLAYLKTLGRARQAYAGQGIDADVEADGMDPAMMLEIKNLCAAPFINPSQARVDNMTPDLTGFATGHTQLFARGRKLFAQNCAGCHGATGDGNGLAAAGLLPKPTNLRQHRFSTPGLAHALWNGVAGSAMPAWRDFSVPDLASLTIYVQSLHTAAIEPQQSAPILARGAAIYARDCLVCHGVQGDGNGPAALSFLPRPANFAAAQPDTARVIQVLNEGVVGTSMPPWPNLAPIDRQAVTAFVRTLFQPGSEKDQ